MHIVTVGVLIAVYNLSDFRSNRMNNTEENEQSLTDEPTSFVTVGTTQIPRLNIARPLLEPSNQSDSPHNVHEKPVRSPRFVTPSPGSRPRSTSVRHESAFLKR
ncbi:hypothetical protein P879_08716 [Paragonimus westermani]|uniref:Uncharacterized protein n=1 Tax=Paragonimus westermani TaxID=34504 RepID=A0A8T0DFQ7_9TREM|nr:hypothetical protein P879_08716 [Paragonimus westermani]